MNSYIRIRLNHVPHQFEDELTTHCFEFGCTGVTEALPFTQSDLSYEPDVVQVKNHSLDVYFPEKPAEAFYQQLRDWSPKISWEIFEEETKDWLAEWKKGFVPFQLTGPFWVIPSWLTPPKEAEKPIYIDPGMAFGTGTHATTQMASYFVQKLCSGFKNPAEKSLIDVGTGTGILAMVAAHYGLGRLKGIEIDPEARRVARENIEKNKLPVAIEITEELVENIKEKYDVVVANIVDGILIRIKAELLAMLQPGGQIFLTGILLEREEIFIDEFIKDSGLEIVRRIEKDEWVGFWLKT